MPGEGSIVVPTRYYDGIMDSVVRLKELLLARMLRNAKPPLSEVWRDDGGFSEPDDELVQHLLGNREELSWWMREIAASERSGHIQELRWEDSPEAFLRGLVAGWLQRKNQFVRVDDRATRQLEASYRSAFDKAARILSSRADDARAAEQLREVWEAHRERLVSFVRHRLGADPYDVTSAAYSPARQLAVLGLAPESMPAPVLDVGCGRDAALVRYLRERGLEAFGIDRNASPSADGVLNADWLEFVYGDGIWGMVVSHLGFSLHFLRHHLAGGPVAEDLALEHARAYKRILGSLRSGGSFVYVPALPFVEELLPGTGYACERFAVSEVSGSPVHAAELSGTGLNLFQAARVSRL